MPALVFNTSSQPRVWVTRITGNYNIDIDNKQIANQYEQESGLCDYSGMPLTREGIWQFSVERRNTGKGRNSATGPPQTARRRRGPRL